MSFKELLADALMGDLPIVIVGDAADTLYPLAIELGFRLARIDAHSSDDVSAYATWNRDSTAPWLIVVENCHHVPATVPGDDGASGPDDALFELAFDGDPSFPANTTLVLLFDEPTEVSEALADDQIPCAFLAPDEEPQQLARAA